MPARQTSGGNNALYLKKHFRLTLTDLPPRMLAFSATINPACEHIPGDMRTLRLRRQLDFVFVHDAISFMTTEADLRRAIKTAFLHCRAGGCVLLQPDNVRETFRPSRDCGGHRADRRSARYTELTHAMKPGRDSTTVDYTLTLKDRSGTVRAFRDRRHIGVFARARWLHILNAQGFSRATDRRSVEARLFSRTSSACMRHADTEQEANACAIAPTRVKHLSQGKIFARRFSRNLRRDVSKFRDAQCTEFFSSTRRSNPSLTSKCHDSNVVGP